LRTPTACRASLPPAWAWLPSISIWPSVMNSWVRLRPKSRV
jgi:hypothetical protein